VAAMENTFEHVDIDEEQLIAGEIASIEQDWSVVTAMLPAQWQSKAVELGAVRRLRGFSSVEALLRVLLIHLADGCSLRETVVRARAGNLADISDVALLKRLRGCGAWFEWMIQEMAANMSLSMAPNVTETKEGESLTRFSIHAGDVVMADRGFTNRRGVRHVVQHNADVVLRMNLTNLPLEDALGQSLALLPLLRTLAIGQAADWSFIGADGRSNWPLSD